MFTVPEGLTNREKAVLDLHKPLWQTGQCPTPLKGCDRQDCHLPRRDERGYQSNYHLHTRAFQVCEYCTDTGDPYQLPPGADKYPCPTAAIILGETL